jgi:hypothetical protein
VLFEVGVSGAGCNASSVGANNGVLLALTCLLLLLLQVTLFISGVLCGDAELRAALEPFGQLLRAFVVTNPQVRRCE